MAAIGVKQLSFAGGELTPSGDPRVDLIKYATGARTMLNFYVARHGAAYNRAGTEYVVEAKDSSVALFIHAFDFNDDNAYIILFNKQTIRIVVDGAALLSGTGSAWSNSTVYTVGDIVNHNSNEYYSLADHTGVTTTNEPGVVANDIFWHLITASGASSILEIPTPYTDAEVNDIRITQSADIMTVTHKSHPPYELIRNGLVDWTFLPVRFAPNVSAPTGITLVDTATAGTDIDGSNPGAIYKVTAIKKGTSEESLPGVALTGAGAIGDISAQGVSSDISVSDTAHGLNTGQEIHITAVATNSASETNQTAVEALLNRTFKITKTDANNFTLDDTAGLLTLPSWYPNSWPAISVTYGVAAFLPKDDGGQVQRVPTGNNSSQLDLTWTTVVDAEEYWVYRASLPIDSSNPEEAGTFGFLGSTKKTTFTDDGKVTPDTEQPPPDHPPPFVLNDWPSVSNYYQQRQVFANSVDNPRKVWLSRTGDFRNFTTRIPLADSDSIEFDVQGERVNEVRHAMDIGTLLLLTRGAVQVAAGDSDGVIKPNAINLRWQAPYGAGTVTPAAIGDSVLYVDTRRSIVRDVGYTIDRDKYAASDLTSFAAHLFDGRTIVQMAFSGTPHPILWCVRDDGILLGLTHLRDHQISGWHQHVTKTNAGGSTDTASVIESCAIIPESDVDTLYLVVNRTINSSTVRYLERQKPRRAGYSDYDYRVDPWFVDSGLGYDGTNLLSNGTTVDATTVLTLTPPGSPTWLKDATGYTLTSTVGAAPFPGDTTNVGNGYRIALADGTYAEVEVTTDGSTTVQTVKLLTDVPSGLQSVGTALWVRMVDNFTGADHLNGETIVLCADGVEVAAAATVSSGAFSPTDGRPYGIVRAGLRITADLETLDLDIANQLDSVADREKKVAGATLYLEDAEGLQVASVTENGANTLYPFQRTNVDGLNQIDTTTGLAAVTPVTGKRRARVTTTWGQLGRLRMRQTAPLPVGILGIVTDVDVKGRKP